MFVSLLAKVSWTPLLDGHPVTHVLVESSAYDPSGHVGTQILVIGSPKVPSSYGHIATHKLVELSAHKLPQWSASSTHSLED